MRGLSAETEVLFANDRTVALMTFVKGAFMSDDGGGKWRSANEGPGVAGVGPGNKFRSAPLRKVVFTPDYANDGTISSTNWVRIVKSTDRGDVGGDRGQPAAARRGVAIISL